MRGPAYDKSSVGGAKNGQAALTQGEQEAPKWEGTKIVKTATKKYGQFGSGGRRDQLKALEARKAKAAAAQGVEKKGSVTTRVFVKYVFNLTPSISDTFLMSNYKFQTCNV